MYTYHTAHNEITCERNRAERTDCTGYMKLATKPKVNLNTLLYSYYNSREREDFCTCYFRILKKALHFAQD